MGCLKITYPTEFEALEQAPIFHLPYLGKQFSYSKKRLNYSPFGVTLENRNLKLLDPVSGNPVKRLRYGFQNQEMDDELKGEGNSLNYSFRMHDPRLGRFLSLDPLAANYPWNSTYAFAENRVIDGIDLEGLEHYYTANGVYMGQVGNSSECRQLNSKADEIHVRNALYKQMRNSTKVYAKWYVYDINSALKNSTPMLSATLVASQIKTSISNWKNAPKEEYYLTELNVSDHPPGDYQSSPTTNNSSSSSQENTTNANDDMISGVNDVMGEANKRMANLFSTAVMDSKGKIHFQKPSGRVFTGNQYRTVSSLASYGRSFKYLARGNAFIGYYFDGKELLASYRLDGGLIGINTTRKLAGMAGKAAGSSGGAVVGAEIGSVGGPIGMAIGAGVGSLVGGSLGETTGETAVDLFNSNNSGINVKLPDGWLRSNQKVDNTGVGNGSSGF